MPDTGKVINSLKYKVGSDPEVAVTGNLFVIPAAPAGSTITVTVSIS